ncbi:RNA-directed DNA polymerase (reverse transcriptase)-related family protein [Rhynchospora pubera]|uniref:RNA-directed DNA polymerase (Reverse transcriptase)-related family protein n=1 Tax=Rhynchospora pubera TaxID=906938 RepID=A0AAV8H3J2_9POAL|nr:RNA-directed DNA polymerase (reverse transcriptase)-related family protein [Rhynchospora pubera]
MRKKRISNLLVEDQLLTDPRAILHAFTEYYSSLLGRSVPVHSCSLHTLYGERLLLSHLDSPFSVFEIQKAVVNLANNKASGPDGLPNEFANIKWDVVKQDIIDIFSDLFHGNLILDGLNFAHITLLPKTTDANTLTSFRPISIINYIPKLIAKVLANRLASVIDRLISPTQTGFVKGRLIHENFLAAREIISHLTKSKEPTVLLKIDFYKAFDTVNWCFLYDVLNCFGIPPNFLSWIKLLISTASSALLVNNQVGLTFQHHQGLRQGDPLSPFLFIIVADVLAKMCDAVSTSVPFSISNRLPSPFHILQYADDTLIFSTVKGNAIQALKLTLTMFSLCSGLNLNLSKSTFVPFNLSNQQIEQIKEVLMCDCSNLPLPYLGLPLTACRPSKETYLLLLEKLENKLAGWKNKLLSRAGRLTLVSSILSTILISFMSVFKLPVWVIKAIDKIRRGFIWGRSPGGSNDIPLLAWDRVCLPKSFGGFGISNLQLLNLSLLLRWLWRLFDKQTSQWTLIAKLLIASRNQESPLSWSTHGSFFWKDLLQLRHLFSISTIATIGDGKNTLFWYANWGHSHLSFFNGVTRPLAPTLTVHKVLSNPATIIPAPWPQDVHNAIQSLQNIHPTMDTADVLRLIWDSSGSFTVNSAYNMLVSAGKMSCQASSVWKVKLPPSVHIFALLLYHNRLQTQEALLRRNFMVQQGCVLCSTPILETATHLFCDCTYALQLWNKVQSQFPSYVSSGHQHVQALLIDALSEAQSNRGNTKAVVVITTLWAL